MQIDFIMEYKIIRIDGNEDELTSQIFLNYADAYDLLKKMFGDICCSDTDFENIPYYNIVEK